jgi:hypothetical protein
MRVYIILHNVIIDDEGGGSYDENYHAVIFIVAISVTYEAPASFTTIFQRDVHLTYELIFLNLPSNLDQACVKQVPLG